MKKNIVIHIGLPKTGSTAIQAFLARNIKLLADHGISYPFITEAMTDSGGISEGNVLHEFVRLAKQEKIQTSYEDRAPTFFKMMIENAIEQSDQPIILISGEELSALAMLNDFVELSKRHNIRIIAFARDPYDILCSSWKQQVKVSGEVRSFETFVRNQWTAPKNLSISRLAQFVRQGLDITVLSYDACRNNLIAAFLQAINVTAPAESMAGFIGNTHNRSLSLEEASLVVMASNYTALNWAPHLLARFAKRAAVFSDPVIAEIDAEIREFLRDDIETLNTRLPPDQKLRTFPRGGIALSDLAISYQNVDFLLNTLSEVNVRPAASQSRPSAEMIELGLPEDFDAERYLLLNPDVERAGLGAEYHYLNHGRWESRLYKQT
ncbi:sulfotransferase domain-containing protein [Cypionkella sinensis]|uniref:sulfotransferase domain-containing protein n=1 Tax=Cypionkella sinensis TaxID=1756043 RepID=UPI00362AB4B5